MSTDEIHCFMGWRRKPTFGGRDIKVTFFRNLPAVNMPSGEPVCRMNVRLIESTERQATQVMFTSGRQLLIFCHDPTSSRLATRSRRRHCKEVKLLDFLCFQSDAMNYCKDKAVSVVVGD